MMTFKPTHLQHLLQEMDVSTISKNVVKNKINITSTSLIFLWRCQSSPIQIHAEIVGRDRILLLLFNKKLINFTFTDEDLNKACRDQLTESDCEKQSEEGKFKCYHLPQINRHNTEDCTEPGTYDYFSNSESSFILTFIGVGIVILGK